MFILGGELEVKKVFFTNDLLSDANVQIIVPRDKSTMPRRVRFSAKGEAKLT